VLRKVVTFLVRRSLSVFSSATIARKGSNKQDEDLSLFGEQAQMNTRSFSSESLLVGVLDTCRSGLGSQILRRWMMRPLLSLPHIKARHQAVEVLIKAENRQVLKSIRDGMKAIKNVHYVFSKMNSGDLSDWTCWRNLAEVSLEQANTASVKLMRSLKLLNGSLLIVETIGNLRGWESVEICKKVSHQSNAMLSHMVNHISRYKRRAIGNGFGTSSPTSRTG
jgi:DNA mismatch repair ATPase MutS